MKKFLKVVIVIVIIAGLLYGGYYIAKEYILNKEEAQENNTVLTQVDINNLNISKEEIYQMIDLGDGDCLLVTKDKLFDENYEPIEGAQHNNYYIYKYNNETGIEGESVNIEQFFEVVNVDKDKKEIYIRTYSQGSEIDTENVTVIKYETMQKEDVTQITQDKEALNISNNGSLWTYLEDNKIYISGTNFENQIVVVEGITNEVYVRPCAVIGDRVIYESHSHLYPEKNGFGIINADKTTNIFININEPNYLGYNELTNEIYYTQKSIENKVLAVNIDNLDTKEVISVSIEENDFISNYDVSKDFKYLAFLEYGEEEGLSTVTLKVYNLVTKEIYAIHKFDNIDSITDIYFENNNIFVVQNGKVNRLDVKIEE